MLDNTPNQLSKFKTKYWVKINDDSRGTYNINNQIKFKTLMLKSNLCDYNDAYILAKGIISVAILAGSEAAVNHDNKKLIFKNCDLFTDCISEIGSAQVYIVILIY